MLLVKTVRKSGLDAAISAALTPWRKPRAVHDPGKILDVALAVALGGDCLADVGMLRAEPSVFGPVASDPTVSRLVDALATSGPKALTALRAARSEVRTRVWETGRGPRSGRRRAGDRGRRRRAGARALREAGRHTNLEDLRPPSPCRVRRPRPGRVRGPVAALLRPGNAVSNTAADHIETAQPALAQLPKCVRRGRQTLIRTDSVGGTHAFLGWLCMRGRWLSYSVGMTITDAVHQAAAAQLVHTGRRSWLRQPSRWPWTAVITRAVNRLHALPMPGWPATSTVPTTCTTAPVKWNPALTRRESPGPQPASAPKRPHHTNTEPPPANRQRLMNDRG